MKNKKNNKKNVVFTIFIIIIIGISVYNIWIMYKNIEISTEYETMKMSLSTDYAKNVDNSTDSKVSSVDMLEVITKSVCRNF